jgi:uncharacterized iron-regulated membrane protein
MATSFRRLWFEPRRSSFRHWIFLVHQWAGVGVGLYFAMMGLTGSISVFLPELRNALVAPVSAPTGSQKIGLQALQSNIEEMSPWLRLRAVYPGLTANQADLFEEQSSDRTVREIAIDPYNAHILVDRRRGATLYDRVRDLHANLLNGDAGKTINGCCGILLLLTGLTGLVVWWPGKRHMNRNTFRVSVRKGLHRLSFDLHRLAGVLVVVPLSVAAVSGIGMALPHLADKAVSAVLGPAAKAFHPTETLTPKYASLDRILQAARERIPAATATRIQAPSPRNRDFVVFMHLPGDWRDEGDNRVLVEADNAAIREVQLGTQLPLSSRVIAGMASVHYGQYGGIPTRVFALLVGLTIPFLYATGMVLWWRRAFRRPLGGSGSTTRAGPVPIASQRIGTIPEETFELDPARSAGC